MNSTEIILLQVVNRDLDVALALFQFIALTLPALAILLQIAIEAMDGNLNTGFPIPGGTVLRLGTTVLSLLILAGVADLLIIVVGLRPSFPIILVATLLVFSLFFMIFINSSIASALQEKRETKLFGGEPEQKAMKDEIPEDVIYEISSLIHNGNLNELRLLLDSVKENEDPRTYRAVLEFVDEELENKDETEEREQDIHEKIDLKLTEKDSN